MKIKSLRSHRNPMSLRLLVSLLTAVVMLLVVTSAGAGVTLTATKTDALVVDVDGDSLADPGDTLEYTVVITNNTASVVNNLVFADTVDVNTTFVSGSLTASPVAVNDTYPQTVIGNVSIDSSLIPYSVTSNDFLGLNPTATIGAFDATSVNGGQVTMTTSGANMGQFTYNPPPGFEGTDTFTYTLNNSNGSNTATVSIAVSGMVWFINNAASSCTTLAAGCGRLSNPFSTLAAFNALNNGSGSNPAANDNIFVYESATQSTGAMTLLSGQKLIGQDATGSLATISGLTPPSSSPAFPAMNSGNGTVTNIGSTVTLNTNTTVRGLQINSTTNTGLNDPAAAITGVSVSDISVSSTTATAVALSDVGGTFTFTSISSNGGTSDGISITNQTGSFTVNGDGSDTSLGGNGTGGTIQNKSGADGSTSSGIGIYLNGVNNITLRRMTINGTNQNYGLRGNLVNGFTLEYSTVGGTNGTAASLTTPENYGEGAIYFGNATTNGVVGTVTFTKNNISGGRARNLSIVNTAAGTTTLTVKGNTFGAEQNLGDAGTSFAVEARVNSGIVINSTIGGTAPGEGNTFTSAVGDLVNFTGQENTTMDVVMRNNSLSDNHAFNIAGGGGLTLATAGTMTFHVTGNTMRDANGSAVTLFKASATSGTPSMSGFFDNNTIGVNGVTDSGSKTGNGIFISAGGTGTMSYTITNNVIHEIHGNAHIWADNTGGSYTANFDIRGNTFDTPGAGWFAGIGMTNGSPSSSDTVNVCAKIGGATGADKNTLSLGGNVGVIVGSSGANGGHTFNLPGYAGGANLTNVQNFIQGNNNGSFATSAYADAPATADAFTGTGTGCSTPTAMLLPNSTRQLAQANVDVPSDRAPRQNETESTGFNLTLDLSKWLKQAAFVRQDRQLSSTPASLRLDLPSLSALVEPLAQLFAVPIASAAPAEMPNSAPDVALTVGALPANKSVTIKFRAIINATLPSNVTQVSNQGMATFDGGSELTDDPATPASNDATITLIPASDLAVTKSDSPDPVNAGENITYTIDLNNNGAAGAQAVTLTDAVPTNTTFVSALVTSGSGWTTTAPAAGGTGNVVFSKTTMLASESAAFQLVVKVSSSTANGTTITNSATAATTSVDSNSSNNTGAATTTVQTRADLALTKSDSPDPVNAKSNITYTLSFVNNGPSDAQTVGVTDTVPSNTTFVSAQLTSGVGWSTAVPPVGGTGNIVFSKATMAAAESAAFEIVVKVNANIPNATTITNSATAASATTDPVAGNNTGNATTTAYNTDLTVTKTNDVSGSIPQGGTWKWKLTAQNSGGVAPSFAAGQTILVDVLPGTNISYNAPAVGNFNGTGTINCAIASNTLTCTAGTAVSIPADTGKFDVEFTATPSAAGTFTNPTGGVCQVDPNDNVTESNEANNNCSTNSVTVVAPPVISKTFGASNIALNGTTALTITLTNPTLNSVALTGVAMTDALPPGLQVAMPPNASNTCGITFAPAPGATTLNATGVTLGTNISCTLNVDVTGTTPGPKTNTTNAVTSTNGGMGNAASATLQVAMPPQIGKRFAAATKAVNETTALTFAITNTDSVVSLTGIGFTDNLPSGLQVASAPNPSNSCGGSIFTTLAGTSAITLTNGNLAPSASCSLSVDVVATTVGVKNNTTSNVTSNEGGNGNTASASITITPVPTTATITEHTPSPSIFNQTVTFTATVTSAQGIPTGTVTLNEGATVLGSGTLNAGTVTFAVSNLPVGAHTITATYQANGNFASSTSPSITHIVNLAPTTTTITGHTPSPSVYHQTVTFTATVTSTQGLPSGTVTLQEGAATLGTSALNAGEATFSISSLSAGTHTITATYQTDGSYGSSTSPSIAHTVNKASTATTVSSSSPTTVFGQDVTFTATVTSSQGTPTGTATFFDGATSLGDGTLDASGIAAMTTNALSVTGSPHTITAKYNGDNNFAESTSAGIPQNVNQASTTTALATSTNPTYGQSVYFTATLSVTLPGSGTPTGSVTFYDGASVFYTGTLAGNIATFMTNTLAVNSGVAHNMTARYNGAANFSASAASPVVAVTVVPATLNVTADDKSKVYGAALPSLTASYIGFVLGQDAGVLSGAPLLTTAGLPSSAVGGYPITVTIGSLTAANYTFHLVNGTLTITAAPLTVTANDLSKLYGAPNPALTASITGFVNGDTAPAALTGAPSLATTALAHSPVGTYPISVTQGTLANVNPLVPNYALSFVNGTLTVNKDNTGTNLSAGTPNPSTYGQTVTFTANVTSSQGITPNGSVTFKDGATTLGTGTLNVGGVATFATSALTASGSPHSITATYGGSSNFNASAASAAVAQTVSKATTAITLTAAPPNPSLTGQAVTVNFTVTVNLPGGGTPTGTVTVTDGTVSCSASVAAGTCLITFNSAGAKTLTATYGGDSNFAVSTSNAVIHTVTLGSCTPVASQIRPSLQQQQPYRLFLPFVQSSQGTPMPDLIVQSIRPINNTLQIVLLNQGNAAVTDEFWVDLYINPNPVPTKVNQIWQNLGSQGAVWGVTAGALPGLGANGTLTLTAGDGYYWPSLSNLSSPLPTGTCIYAQVDSASTITTYGAVLETHEVNGGPYNNISGMQLSGPATLTNRASAMPRAAPSNRLPSRR